MKGVVPWRRPFLRCGADNIQFTAAICGERSQGEAIFQPLSHGLIAVVETLRGIGMFGNSRVARIDRRRLPGFVFWGAFLLFNLPLLGVVGLWVRSHSEFENLTGMAALARADAIIFMFALLFSVWSLVNGLFAWKSYRIYVAKGRDVPE